MTTLAIYKLWSFLQSLSLTASNERWLAERLLESANAKSVTTVKEQENAWANYQLSPEILKMTLKNRKQVSDAIDDSLYESLERKIQLYVSAITFVNAFFILRKSYSREELYQSMLGLASLCEITDVDKEIIKKCLSFERKDFEDSVQYESALLHQVDVIVTRNVKDFRDFAENVQTPADFLESILV